MTQLEPVIDAGGDQKSYCPKRIVGRLCFCRKDELRKEHVETPLLSTATRAIYKKVISTQRILPACVNNTVASGNCKQLLKRTRQVVYVLITLYISSYFCWQIKGLDMYCWVFFCTTKAIGVSLQPTKPFSLYFGDPSFPPK